jgi:hypothetical protein
MKDIKLSKEEIRNLKDILVILESMEVQKLMIKIIMKALKDAEVQK